MLVEESMVPEVIGHTQASEDQSEAVTVADENKIIQCSEGKVTCKSSDWECVDFSPVLCDQLKIPAPPPKAKKIEEPGAVAGTVRDVTNHVTIPTTTVVKHVTDIVHQPAPPVVHDVLAYKVKRAHYDLVKEVVPAKPGPFIKIVKYRSPAPPGPVKVVYVPKPVPVPVPAPSRKVQCSVNVRDCFAKNIGVLDPVFANPMDHFTGNYNKMCGDERSDKQKVMEKKHKSEGKTKELCSKAEKATKADNLKYKLVKQKEASSKAVAESKEKYLEKKVKSVQEAAAKGLGASKEKLAKTQEKANKSEDEMYKKECAAKEGAYKTVRESKQKVRVIYVTKPIAVQEVKKKPVPAPAPIKKVVETYAPKPQPVVQQKTTIYVPAPVLQSAAPAQDDGVKEKTHKTAERVQKSADISKEAINKVDTAGKEHVSKEFQQKRNVHLVSEEKEKAKAKKEARCKEQESKESRAKAEIHQKLAVEKVRKEIYTKERETKKLAAPAPAPPCNPDSAVERYVKKCKAHEERFAKSAHESEKTLKEVKVKRRSDLEEAACSFTTKMCKDIYAATRVRNDEMSKMIVDHAHKLEAAYVKADSAINDEADKIKYHICRRASEDMSYFARNFILRAGAKSEEILKLGSMHQ